MPRPSRRCAHHLIDGLAFACVVGVLLGRPADVPFDHRSVAQRPDSPGEPAALQGFPVIESAVRRLLINPYGEVDGLQLEDGRLVKFPPHRGAELEKVASSGDLVRIFGHPERFGMIHADAIVNMTTGASVIEQPQGPAGIGPFHPRPRPKVAALEPLQTEGRVAALLTGRRGEVNGVLLDNGCIVRFPPHRLRQRLQTGDRFGASGMGSRNSHGISIEALSLGPSLQHLEPIALR